jgi:dihydrofolate reductase
MGQIVNATFISLDGVVENPQLWPSMGDDGGEGDALQQELLFESDAVVMGRRTYEGFAPVWPTRSDPYSDRINEMPKYVVSSTLTDPEWNNTTVISEDPVPELRRLREAGNLLQYGFGQLSFTMMEAGLLDELRLWFHPLFVGNAEPSDLLYGDTPPALFEHAGTEVLKNGIVVLTYRYSGRPEG